MLTTYTNYFHLYTEMVMAPGIDVRCVGIITSLSPPATDTSVT